MEATEKKKKHNGGYYLKEKIAKLEAENKELKTLASDYKKKYEDEYERYSFTQDECDRKDKRLTEEINRANKAEAERDSWHNKYKSEHDFHVEAAEKRREAVSRLEFLIDHCPFWVRWMYKHEFN